MTIIRAVLFDVDDTLFDYSGAERAGILAHLAEEGLLDAFADPSGAVDLWRRIMTVEYERYLDGRLTLTGQQRARARAFVAAVRPDDPPLDDGAAGDWFTRYHRHYRAAWRAFPDADPALAALAARGLRLGVVSNSNTAKQRVKLRLIGLADRFAGAPVICSEEHGAAKPAASIFHAACGELGLAPELVAHVGDKREVDAAGARDAGLTGIWLDRAGAEPDGGSGGNDGNGRNGRNGREDGDGAVRDGGDGITVVRTLAALPGLL